MDSNKTLNSTSNNTESANSTSQSNQTEDNSVASVYPYWRATREEHKSKNDKEEKKPFEPRPAKYKENYEDKGFKVFKPDFEHVGSVTTDTYKKLGGPDSSISDKKSKTENEE